MIKATCGYCKALKTRKALRSRVNSVGLGCLNLYICKIFRTCPWPRPWRWLLSLWSILPAESVFVRLIYTRQFMLTMWFKVNAVFKYARGFAPRCIRLNSGLWGLLIYVTELLTPKLSELPQLWASITGETWSYTSHVLLHIVAGRIKSHLCGFPR